MAVKRFGNKNAFIITLQDGTIILQSYQTPVAAIIDGRGYKTDERWSVTTSRQISQFFTAHGSSMLASAAIETRPQQFFYNLSPAGYAQAYKSL